MTRKTSTRLLEFALLGVPTLAAMIWTCYPAALVAWGVVDAPSFTLPDDGEQDNAGNLDVRRLVQKHFLNHHVYIPLEDIITAASDKNPAPATETTSEGAPSLIMQKACGRGRLFVWLPLKFRLPITGEKVIEWCWKPQTKDT